MCVHVSVKANGSNIEDDVEAPGFGEMLDNTVGLSYDSRINS